VKVLGVIFEIEQCFGWGLQGALLNLDQAETLMLFGRELLPLLLGRRAILSAFGLESGDDDFFIVPIYAREHALPS